MLLQSLVLSAFMRKKFDFLQIASGFELMPPKFNNTLCKTM